MAIFNASYEPLMKKQTLLVASILLILALNAFADTWHTTLPLGNNRTELTIKNGINQGFTGYLQLGNLEAFEVATTQGAFVRLNADGFVHTREYGRPAMPTLTRMIEIPAGADWQIHIIAFDEQEYNLTEAGFPSQVFPAQPSLSKSDDPSQVPFIFDAAAYQTNLFSSYEMIQVEQLGMMRGVQLGRLSIHPFNYNPVTNTLKVYNNIQFELVFTGGNNAEKNRAYSPYYQSLFGRLINYELPTKALIETAPVKFVIVSNPMFESQLQAFIAWKIKKGFQVIEAYTNDPAVGTTTASIKAYLKNLYTSATASDPAPSFVLLVGDVAQLPTFTGTSGSHVSDLYYFTYDAGTDIYPEVFYGRFSATNASQLQPQLDKTLDYEQYLFDDASFLNNVVLVAGVDASMAPTYGNGQLNYGTSNYFNAAHGLNTYSYLYPASASSGAVIKQNVSNGVSFANYTAHCSSSGWGDPSFVTSDVPALQNESKYPLMVGNCCLSSKFDDSECFAEAVLRADKKGALGYIGGSNSTYWDEDFWYSVGNGSISANPTYAGTGLGFYDRMFHDHGEPESAWFVTNGQIVQAGNMAVTQAGGSETYYWEIYHLMGDPSVTIYMGVPDLLVVNHPSGLPLGSTSVSIQTEENAYMALSVDSILIAAGIADATGLLTLNFPSLATMSTIQVVGTKQDRAPYISTMNVFSANNPYVIGNGVSVNDANGNNNGYADYQEHINLNIQLNNLGMLDASNLTAVLSTTDQAVSILNATVTIPSITSQQTLDVMDAFEVQISDEVEDMHQVLFTLNISDNSGNSWQSFLSLTIYAPKLAISSVNVSDDQTGNGNGRFEPGEVIELSYQVINEGHAALGSAIGQIVSSNTNVQTYALPVEIQGMNISQTETITGLIQIISNSGNAVIELSVEAGFYSVSDEITRSIGKVSEDWESQGFAGFAWVNTSTVPWLINQTNASNNTFSARSGDIGASQNTSLTLTMEAATADTIQFDVYVSCEEQGWSYYDYLEFFIDNVSKGKWAGEVSWTTVKYPVTAGSHTYKWTYKKDSYDDQGEDLARIDNILLPVTPEILANQPPVIISQPDTLVMVDEFYAYIFEASDPDGNTLSLNQSGLPSFITYTDNGNQTATMSGTPASIDKGIYPVVLTAWDGVAFGSQVYFLHVIPNIGIPESATGFIQVSPNPASESILVQTNQSLKSGGYLSIYNKLGMLVKTIAPAESTPLNLTIDISDLPAGMYLIEYLDNDMNFSQKFIKINN